MWITFQKTSLEGKSVSNPQIQMFLDSHFLSYHISAWKDIIVQNNFIFEKHEEYELLLQKTQYVKKANIYINSGTCTLHLMLFGQTG